MTSTLPFSATSDASTDHAILRYSSIRSVTLERARGLEPEDRVLQSMPDASPVNWHLAHTTWFFEQFVLAQFVPNFHPFDERFQYLFNSYYETIGDRVARAERGMLSRPTYREITRYREHVDDEISLLVPKLFGKARAEALTILEIGLQHEQQHQELMATDLKHAFSRNPLMPALVERRASGGHLDPADPGGRPRFHRFDGGLHWIGAADEGTFAFDNEGPRHRVFVEPFEIASHAVTCAEWIEFIEAGGYDDARLWLSAGWDRVRASDDRWIAPLYWRRGDDGGWWHFTSAGERPVDPSEPVCHISYYEADAFATWRGARLPTEFEWEVAAQDADPSGARFAASGHLHPAPARDNAGSGPQHMFGNVWEWTSSAYAAYPGFVPEEGALGEYNGKFMSGQFVLRGGSCATPASHARATYRNFFPPDARWQFSGLRLAKNISDRP